MGRPQKYPEDLLVKAVSQYAAQHSGPINASRVAKWASSNIPGLKGVQYYHFIRNHERKAKLSQTARERIHEEIKLQQAASDPKTTVILSGDMDAFLALDDDAKRIVLSETRDLYLTLQSANADLAKQRDDLRHHHTMLQQQISDLRKRLENADTSLRETKRTLKNTILRFRAISQEAVVEKSTSLLASIGLESDNMDLDTFFQSLTQEAPEKELPLHNSPDAAQAPSDLLDALDFGDDDS